jgi:AmmeMemoRadiSam system protein A
MSPDTEELLLDPETCKDLMQFTHDMLLLSIRENRKPDPHVIESLCRQHSALKKRSGAFVTVYIHDKLRGCLGGLEPDHSLAHVISSLAYKAPRTDYRFKPVGPEEIPGLSFKISVLSPAVPVKNPDKIRLGRDGLIARHQDHCGVFLPDVPVEQGWDLKKFLSSLRRKAKIDPGVPWKDIFLTRFTTRLLNSADYQLKS